MKTEEKSNWERVLSGRTLPTEREAAKMKELVGAFEIRRVENGKIWEVVI